MESNISLITPKELKWVNNKPHNNSNSNGTNKQRKDNTHNRNDHNLNKNEHSLPDNNSQLNTHLEDNIINTITTIQDKVDINIDKKTILNTLHDCLVFVQNNKIRHNVQIHKENDDSKVLYNTLVKDTHLTKETRKEKREQQQHNNNITHNNIIKTYRHKPFITTIKTDIELNTHSKNDTQLTLVENNKPHPRMRRTSDNPNTNEFVRVFQLQKRK